MRCLRFEKESTLWQFLPLLYVLFGVVVVSQKLNAETVVFESHSGGAALVELYTSQGCSSCPPAERWFSRLSEDKALWTELFPIAFHVDYWDYLGWRDPFASPAFSQRQRQYARYGHSKNVATPGFVVDGQGWNGWFRERSLPAVSPKSNAGLVHAELNGQDVRVIFSPVAGANEPPASPRVHVAMLAFDIVIPIEGGENQGRDLRHDFVVVGYRNAHLLQTASGWQVNLKRPGTHPYDDYRQAVVIWISDGDDPRPIQVAGGWLP